MRLKPFQKRGLAVVSVAIASLFLGSCKTPNTSSGVRAAAAADAAAPAGGDLDLCVGLRGNGNLIMGHFASLARIVEEFGPITGLAGGSSASISQFLYESMYASPQVSQCAGAPCSQQDKANRLALYLKSLQGYVTYIENTSTIVAFRQLYDVYQQFQNSTIGARLGSADMSAIADLQAILASSELRGIINPEIAQLLGQGDPLVRLKHAQDVYAGIIGTPTYSDHITDNIIFFRPGVVNFQELARLIGRIGSFYAGYGPADAAGTEAFLNACAAPARGKSWTDIANLPAGSSTCGATFNNLVVAYNNALLANEASFPSRADDPVGKYLHVLVGTGLLKGQASVDLYEASLANYRAGQPTNFVFDFSNVGFGYFGRPEDLATVGANPRGYTDPKVKMFTPLSNDKWVTAMGLSPAEPGISRLQEMSTPNISAAGWADVSPTHVLKNLGCKKTILVTRQWDVETPLATGVVKLLGASQAQVDALYSLDVPAAGQPLSSSLQAIADADGVWCTNWNIFTTTQVAEISAQSYNAPMEVHNQALASYVNAKPSLGIRECSVGAPLGTGGH